MQTMTMRSAKHIGPSVMNRRVDHECRGIEHTVRTTVNDLAVVIDLDQVRFRHQRECTTERVYPEGLRINGVSESDVTGDTCRL